MRLAYAGNETERKYEKTLLITQRCRFAPIKIPLAFPLERRCVKTKSDAIIIFADESSLSDRGSGTAGAAEATNSLASGFSSGSSVRKTPGPGALSIPIPPQPSEPVALTQRQASPKPTLVLTSPSATADKQMAPLHLNLDSSRQQPQEPVRCRPPKLDIPPVTTAAGSVTTTTDTTTTEQEESNGGLVFITIIPVSHVAYTELLIVFYHS